MEKYRNPIEGEMVLEFCQTIMEEKSDEEECGNSAAELHFCDQCGYLFKTKSLLPPFFCKSCKKAFYLKTHLIEQNTGKQPDRNLHLCDQCGLLFNTGSSFQIHKESVHLGKELHYCHYCAKPFLNKWSMKYHLRIHTDEKVGKCLKKLNNNSNLAHHHDERSYKCDQCDKCFKSKTSLNTHIRRKHGNDSPYKCDQCDTRFKSKANLNTHIRRTHVNDRPYKCEECFACFKSGSNLNYHMLVHSDERPYECDRCGMCFKKVYHLQRHKKIHSEIKPFACKYCSKRFHRRDNLIKHKSVHTKE